MAFIVIQRDFVAVSCGNKIKIYSLTSDQVKLVEIPKQNEENKNKKEDSRNGRILCMKFSPCTKYLAVCNDKKQLIVWETRNFNLVNSRLINKQASQLCFTQKQEILVADRSGDVYLHFIHNLNANKFIIGRISLLIDLVLSNDSKYLITCDRDEKICISHFPNSYNIKSYCLGHTEFVSCIALLPSKPDILVSTSGDGTLRFWDFQNGIEKLCVNSTKEDELNVKLNRLDTNRKTNAIKKCICAPNTNIIAILYFSYDQIELYSMEIGREITSKCIQTLNFSFIPFDACFDENGHLFVLIPDQQRPIVVFKEINDDQGCLKLIEDNEFEKNVKLNDDSDFFKDAKQSSSDLNMMFKQWFDNVGEYLARKEERIAEKNKKKIKNK